MDATTMTDATVAGTVTVPSFTMRAGLLRDVLGSVVVATGKDDTLPTLTAVRIEWADGGRVAFAATDRYRLIVAAADSKAADGSGALLLPRAAVAELVKLLPSGKRRGRFAPDPVVTVTVVGDHVTFRMDGPDGSWSREFRLLDGDFPRFHTLIPDAATLAAADPIKGIGWNPRYMAEFAKCPLVGDQIHWEFTAPNRPMVAKLAGTDWELSLLLMPVRRA